MIKLCMEHVDAVSHAALYTLGATETTASKHIRAALEKDLLKLAELKLYIIQKMTEPVLPYDEKQKPNGHTRT